MGRMDGYVYSLIGQTGMLLRTIRKTVEWMNEWTNDCICMPLNKSCCPSGRQSSEVAHTRLHLMLRQTAEGGKWHTTLGREAWWGALQLDKMASVAMQPGTKAIYTRAPLSPIFFSKPHRYITGLRDKRQWFGTYCTCISAGELLFHQMIVYRRATKKGNKTQELTNINDTP